jgi:hypothetical protein
VQYANARLPGLVFHRSHCHIDMAYNALEYIFAALLDAPLDPLPVVARRTGPQTLVALGLPDPDPQGLRRAADLRRDRADRRPLRGVIPLVVEHHPNRTLANLR